MTRRLFLIALTFLLLLPTQPVAAQSDDPPTYIIQPGDTINSIALRFDISAQDLIDANQISDPNFLVVGTTLKLPGISGVSGLLTTIGAPFGATLDGLVKQYRIGRDLLVKLNKISSPSQVYVGSTLILPQDENNPALTPSSPVPAAQSVLELAATQAENPWLITLTNQAASGWELLPGEPLYTADPAKSGSMFGSSTIDSIQISPLPLVQGATEVITVQANGPVDLSGSLDGNPLTFFQVGDNQYVALQGIYALADTGLADFSLKAETSGKTAFSTQQSILLTSGYYPQEQITVDPSFLDPAVTVPEDEKVKSITASATPQKYWSDVFIPPVDEPICIYSGFGTRRSYNGGPYNAFHTGLDYGVCANLNIYAPAPGKVVYVGELTVRGQATIIDHGWGVYSGFWHQSAVHVQAGDVVEAGQLIGEIGSSGRVTGPHLHWEVWVNGVQVNPQDWLDNTYP